MDVPPEGDTIIMKRRPGESEKTPLFVHRKMVFIKTSHQYTSIFSQ